jgi:uncharacterized protein involved in outer membrane biogenesis
MSKKLKITIFVFGSLIILFALIATLAAFLIDLNTYRQVIAIKIEETLHRKVYIGQIQHTLWTGLGAEISKVTILDKDESRPFMEAERIKAHIRWLPLLENKIEVSSLTLRDLKVLLEREESGVWNFEDILPITPTTAFLNKYGSVGVWECGSMGVWECESTGVRSHSYTHTPILPYSSLFFFSPLTAEAAMTDDEQRTPFDKTQDRLRQDSGQATDNEQPTKFFSIDLFKIVNGTVIVLDHKVNKESTFSSINLEAENIAPGSQVPFTLSTAVNEEKPTNGASTKPTFATINASGTVGPLPLKGGLEATEFVLKARLDELTLSRFAPYYKKQLGAESIDGQLGGEIKLTGKLGSYLNSEGTFEVTDFLWKDSEIFTSPLKEARAEVSGNLQMNLLDGDLKFINSRLTIPALMVDVTGEVQDVKTKPQLNLSIKLENLAWDKLLALLPPETRPNLIKANGRPPLLLEGIANITIQPQGSLDDLTLAGTINLDDSHVQYEDLFLKPRGVPGQITFEGHLGENTLTLSNLILNLNNVPIKVVGTIDDLKAQESSLNLKVTSQPFLPEKLLMFFPKTKEPGTGSKEQGVDSKQQALKVTGPGNLDLTIKGKPKDLVLEGSVNFDQSELTYGPKIHKASHIPANLDFNSRFKGDELNLEDLKLTLGTLILNAKGSIKDFTSPVLRLALTTNKFKLDELQRQLVPTTEPLLPTDVTLTGPMELKLQAEGPMNKLVIMTNLDLTDNGIKYQNVFSKPTKLKSDLRVNAELSEGNLNIDNVAFSLGDMILKATGAIGSLNDPKLDLQVDTNTFDLDTLLKAIPVASGALPEELILSGKASLSVKPKGKLDNLNLSGNINLDKSKIQYGQAFRKPEGIPGNLDFNTELKKDAVNVSNSAIQLGNLILRVNGSVVYGRSGGLPSLNVDLSTNAFDMKEFQSNLLPGVSLGDLTLTGASQFQAHLEGPPQALDIKSGLDLTKNQIRYKDFFVKPEGIKSDLDLEASLSKGDVIIKNLNFFLDDLELKAKGLLSNKSEPDLNFEILTNEFDIQKLLQKVPVVKNALPRDLSLNGPTKLNVKTEGALSNLRLSGLVNMDKGEFSYSIFKKTSGITGRLEFNTILKKNRFDIETLKLNLNDAILDIKGFITSSLGTKQFTSPLLDLQVRSNTFAFNQLIPSPDGSRNDSSGKTDLNVNLKGNWNNILTGQGITGIVNLRNVRLTPPEWPKPIENLTALMSLADGKVIIKGLTAQLGTSAFTGNLNLEDLSAPKIRFDLHAARLNLDEIFEMKRIEKKASRDKDAGTQGRGDAGTGEKIPVRFVSTVERIPSEILLAEATKPPRLRKPSPDQVISKPAPTEGGRTQDPIPSLPKDSPLSDDAPASKTRAEGDLLKKMQAQGTVTIDQGTVKQMDFSQLKTQVQMASKLVRLNNLVFDFYDGTHQGSAIIDFNPPQPTYEINTKLVQVNADKLFTEVTSVKHVLYGLLFADVKLRGQSFDSDKISKTLVGNGGFEIRSGKFTAFNIYHELAPLFELIGQIGKIKELLALAEQFRTAPQDTEFLLFKGQFNLQNGQAGTEDLIIQIRDPAQKLNMDMEITGILGLDNAILDLTGKVSFFSDFKYYPELVKYFPERNGKVTIPFPLPIGGTVLNPTLDLSKIHTNVVKFAADIALQKGIQSGLDKIFKKKEEKKEQNLEQESPPEQQAPLEQQPPSEQQPPPETEKKSPTQKKPEEIIEDISKSVLDKVFKKRR